MAQLLIDLVNLSIEHLCQFLNLYLPIDIFIFQFVLFAFEMEGSIYREPIQFTTFELIIDKPFNTS